MNRSVIEQIRDELVAGTDRYELRRRRVRAATISAVLVVALATTAVVWKTENNGGPRVLVHPDATSTTVKRPVVSLTPGPLPGLEQIPSPPGNTVLPSSPIWTGHEFLFVGITVDDGPLIALSFDADTHNWREIARPPSTIGRSASTVWTGRELIICCGDAPAGSGAAAYDPTTDKWQLLPDPPVHSYTSAVWTGTDVIVVASDGVASFDPERDKWAMLPMPPELATFNKAAWTGHDLIVWPAPGSRTVHHGEMFDPDTGKWSTLPAPPERSWPAIPDIAWIDGSLVVLGGLPAPGPTSERLVGARYDPTNGWASLPDPLPEPDGSEGNLGSHVTLWTGQDLLVFTDALATGAFADGVLLAYEPASNSWRVVGETAKTALRPIVMAGDRVLLERDRAYYLSEPGWHPNGAPAPGVVVLTCPAAQHPWQFAGAQLPDTGDGLPPSGTATLAAAERELRDHGAAIIAKYGATSARATVGLHGGWAWKRVDGVVKIVPESLGTIDLVLRDQSSCPSAPAFENGIPVTFEIHPG
jgi:hypothetical protein